MKKYFKKIFILLITFFGFVIVAKAGNVSISASNYTVTVGSTINVKLNITNLSGNFKVFSSDNSILAGGATGWCDDNICVGDMSTNILFSAKKEGSVVVTVSPLDVSDNTGMGEDFTSSRSIQINVVKRNTPSSIDVNRTYSKNNYLKSLSIDGYNLSPDFNKDTLEYNVTLNPGTETINITAVKEDNSASLRGDGTVSVSEGINTINVVVIAENGNERTYVIKAMVEEKDPIEVKINKQKYRVIKKKELIGSKDGYAETTVSINGVDVPALYNEVTKVTLVGLKDENGNISLFAYNTSNGKYSQYSELTFDVMNLYIHEKKNSKYNKKIIKINDIEVVGYKIKGIDEYYLLYATNTSTGYEGYYLYDTKENSVQRYNVALLENLTREKDKYLSIVIILSSVCFLSMLFLLIQVNRESKRKNEG